MRVYQGKEVPKLVEPQCSLLQAEVWTGKVLTLEGKRRDSRSDTAYIITFEDFEEAEKFAQSRVDEHPDIECQIFDHNGKPVKRVVKEGHRRSMQKLKYQWWKFWRWTFRPK